MDISLMVDKYKFNFRVSAVIRRGSQVLLHHSIGLDHATLPGGRVAEGEDTITALKREIKEELGFDTEFVRSVSTLENFFDDKGNRYHEILITHELRFLDESVYDREKIEAIEPHKIGKLEFIWQDTDKLEEVYFVPKKLIGVLQNGTEFTHVINNEL